MERALGGGAGYLLCVAVLAIYFLYALGTGSFTWWRAGVAAAFVLVPVTLAARRERRFAPGWQDYAAALAIFLPFKALLIRSLWPYPEGKLGYVLAVLMALNVAVAVFLLVRGFGGVGYSISWGRNWGGIVALSFLLFAAIAIPLGRAIGFIRFAPNYAQMRNLAVVAVGIFFFTAWPEEFLFRGILQNLISKSLKSEWSGLIAASFLFGAAHLPNGVHFPQVNWRYGILATIAGFFYGWTWKKTGSIFPSALVHAAVDLTWHFFFTAP
ncbi:MAG TPA: type II CAAX endopeptidase family protein [Candidatus Dormibacteraeota bacterium]|nr:type II CAAX endopeptidase family protein [Candidatus Dormibacteraeota bacterium]